MADNKPDGDGKREPLDRALTGGAAWLLNSAGTTHGKLLLMGLCLLFIGGCLTLGSYMLRGSGSGEFHIWTKFLALGAGCLVGSALVYAWGALHGRK